MTPIAPSATASAEEITLLRALLLDMFKQACARPDGLFDDRFVSAYETTQDYLIEHKLIDAQLCVRR